MTKSAPEPARAGIYCRLSLSRDGDTTKVDDQARICRELCGRLGWVLAEGCGHPEHNGVYTDNSKSAWQRNRKRPGWDAMLADVNAGKLTAIVVYHGDRLVRQPRDLEDLLDLAHGKGIRLASPTGTRDLDDDEAQFILGVEANMARRESANISRRTKMGIERRRRAGIVNSGGRGRRLFGFDTDGITHFPADRCSLATRQEVVEADIVRDVFARVLAGEGIRHIAASLRSRGITTTAGTPMHPIAVRRMIASPRYAGLMPDGASAAAWQRMIDRDDWELAAAVISGRASLLAPSHNARRYLLSGIARCGVCGGPMQVLPAYTKSTGQRIAARYGCLVPGCRKVFRKLEHLDAYVTTRTVLRLSHPGNPAGHVPQAPGLAAQFAALATQRGEAEAAIADPASSERLHLLLARLDGIDHRLSELRELAGRDAQGRLLDTHAGITEQAFGALPLATRRALIAACFQVTVLPASKRGPGFRTEDVELVPAGA